MLTVIRVHFRLTLNISQLSLSIFSLIDWSTLLEEFRTALY